jgi:hypothetical protein
VAAAARAAHVQRDAYGDALDDRRARDFGLADGDDAQLGVFRAG